jgi:hypothetical protein
MTRYYYLNLPDGEELYFSVGSFERQITFKEEELTISNVMDRLPKAGSDEWVKLKEIELPQFNYFFKGAITCLNSHNWGKLNPKKPPTISQ